jgi:uncharacterized protein YjbI with pentapeptide repeats
MVMSKGKGTPPAEQEQEPGQRPPWWKRLWGWTGFGEKKLWDWLQLLSALAIPIVIAVAGFWFTAQQEQRQQQIEKQRAENEHRLEDQRAQDAALQAYLDQMNNLLLEHNLRNSKEDSGVRTLARARTLTVLGRLDPSRKTAVMEFLVEAELVGGIEGRGPIISLNGADLSGADLSGADLSDADLRDADLRGANLRDADLGGADLSDAILNFAYLNRADLSGAKLRDAILSGANLRDADLRGANLSDAILNFAYLNRADLSGAELRDADLSGAELIGANLHGANGVTKEGLGRFYAGEKVQGYSLEGTIMPDGTIYPGRYAARKFEPALSFSVSDAWRLSSPETTDALFIEGPEGGQLLFTSPRHVYDPSNPSEPKEVPAPKNTDEWVSWFQSHPHLATSEPVPMSVGGASGKRMDVTGTPPENYPRDVCGEQVFPEEPCVPLYKGSTTVSTIVRIEGWKDLLIIVDVGGETVVIDVTAPADKFDEFLPKARKVLDSVEWKSG